MLKKFFEEFKEFISKGNVMDMAVGVIIGSAFSSIVKSLTDNIIKPLINCIGGADIQGKIHLQFAHDKLRSLIYTEVPVHKGQIKQGRNRVEMRHGIRVRNTDLLRRMLFHAPAAPVIQNTPLYKGCFLRIVV